MKGAEKTVINRHHRKKLRRFYIMLFESVAFEIMKAGIYYTFV